MRFLLLLLVGLAMLPAFADDETPPGQPDRFWHRKAEGWFWYHDPKDEEAVKPSPVPEAQAPAAKLEPKKTPFSVEWLREHMPKVLDAAIDNPTKENVEANLYLQRVALDKAQRYANMTRRVVAGDPFLDENNRVPMSTYAQPIFLRQHAKATVEALRYVATQAGLWVFFDSKCEFCRPQANTVQQFAKEYGFITRFISMDGAGLPNVTEFSVNQGQAQLLNLRITPTTVLVVPPNNYYIVSQGMMAQSQLGDRVLLAAENNNLLSPEMQARLQVYDRGVLTSDDISDGASEDPKVWVKHLKDRLQGRY
jgi:conjugal transfer pilus assembly protein TraF